MHYAVGIDLGGTNIKIAVVSEEGEILERSTSETWNASTGSWAETIKQKI